MIIRSQNKKRITTDLNLHIFPNDLIKDMGKMWDVTDSSYNLIGKYSTEEKAIKVLDMICEHYDKVMDARYFNNEYQENYFQMPQDSEV